MTFEQFVELRRGSLLRFAVVLTADLPNAEELVQDVLGRAYERWDRVGAVEDVNAYVRRMVVNEFVSRRRRWRRVELVRDAGMDLKDDGHADRYAERDALRSELLRLPPKQRAVLALRYYVGLSDTQIAEELGCSSGTVRGYASRAIASLRIRIVPAVAAAEPGNATVADTLLITEGSSDENR